MYNYMKFIAVIIALIGLPAVAGPTDHDTQLTILPGWVTERGSQMVGLRIDMADGWKTYWRAPGDAGIPPQIRWAGSHNINSAAFHWPVPEVFFEGGTRSIGYSDSVTIPMEVFPKTAEDQMHLSGTLDIGVCDEICVPVSLTFDHALPQSKKRDPAIVAALVNRPSTAEQAGIGTVTCQLSPIKGGFQINTRTQLPNNLNPTAVIIETGDPMVWVSEPNTSRTGSNLTAIANLIHVNGTGFAVDRSAIRLTLLSETQAVDVIGCAAP